MSAAAAIGGIGADKSAVGSDGLARASAAAARVAELRQLISEVETGAAPTRGGFAAQLSAASGEGAAVGQATATTPTAPAAAGAAGGGSLNPSVPFAAEIEAAAAKYRLDPDLLAGLIKAESNFDPTVGSGAGAQGLTELMPSTAASVGVKDPHDPAESIDGGAHVLREMLDKFGGDTELALAAYNAGPGAVEQYGGIPPYSETQAYVPRVLGFAEDFRNGATR
ncbi:MAG TPA: lytic transglycosylase domain-containing protein [Solirubrobacterales bacterium]|nr:lytic transglycosylase domain-containing protein [Solirubrobacterales bacterium]